MLTRQEIAKELRSFGLKKGDKILLHSSLASLGKVEGGADAVIDAFLDVVGKKGTLMVPVFGKLGIITETLKARPEAVVSPCPVGTLAGIGPDCEALFKDHWVPESPHAVDTPFYRLAQMGGKVCLLGVDQDRNTSLHGIEALMKLPYLGQVTETFTTPDGKKHTKTWKHYPGPHRNFIGLDRAFIAAGAEEIFRLGNAQLRIMDAKGMWDTAIELAEDDPAFALCENPNCPACVRQRADIFAAYIANEETFKLSVSSKLAGRYVPEMIEKIKRCGIKLVEIDFIQGKSAFGMKKEELKAAVDEFAAAGIGVSALRLPAAPDKVEEMIEKVNFAKITTLLLPAFTPAEMLAALKKAKIKVRLYNCGQRGDAAAAAAFAAKAGFAFSPADFARCGQNPFSVYRNSRFIKMTEQLDVNDGLLDGTPTRLGEGNAEIKEIISILRCQNFSGTLTLGGNSVYPEDVETAKDDLMWLIQTM